MVSLQEMGKFKTVVVDPPWDLAPVGWASSKSNGLNKRIGYGLIGMDGIKSLPVEAVLDEHSLLFCWTVSRFLERSFEVCRQWGADHAFTMTWVKNGGIQLPNGPMHNAEWVLVGKRGSPEFLDIRQFFTANYWPRGSHSEKPEGFYDLLRRVTPEPRLDIFGRRRIPGFVSWGDQAPEGPALPRVYQDVMF